MEVTNKRSCHIKTIDKSINCACYKSFNCNPLASSSCLLACFCRLTCSSSAAECESRTRVVHYGIHFYRYLLLSSKRIKVSHYILAEQREMFMLISEKIIVMLIALTDSLVCSNFIAEIALAWRALCVCCL